jgi:hypothetical protein
MNGGGTTKASTPSSSNEDEGFLLRFHGQTAIGRKEAIWIATKTITISRKAHNV